MRRPRLSVRSAPPIGCIRSRWPRLLLEHPLHHAGTDAELAADLEDAVATGLQLQNSRLHCGINAASAEFGAGRPGACKTSIDPFSDDPPLELSKYTQHLKHRSRRRGRSVITSWDR